MVDVGGNVEKQLREITECSICMSAFIDPRMLQCIHTFCHECLKRTSEAAQMKPGDKMPCPLCRKEFVIPVDGMNGLQKNFFIENVLELKIGSATIIICDICNVLNEGKTGQIATATMRCVECQDNYCDTCIKVHQFQKLNKDHQLVKIGSDTKSAMKRPCMTIYCSKHTQKPLDYYCADCKKIVCVSCFVESHTSHKWKDVTTVDKEFRQTIQRNSSKISIYANKMLSIRKNAEIRKADFLKEIVEKENAIHKRNQELKDIIDEHTKSLVDELSAIKSKHLKEMESGMEEIDRYCTILRNFEAYCTELISKGSASDICSSADNIVIRADELERDHEAFICRPCKSVEVTFEITELKEVLHNFNGNVVGNIKDTTTEFENCAIVVGLDDSLTITKDVIKINLYRPNDISTEEQIPSKVEKEAFAAVYCNTMYVTGVGTKYDEIWKYKQISGWTKCSSLVQGRRRHSLAFMDEVLYICGGLGDANTKVLDSIEAYNAITDKCATVGKLLHCVQNSGNCVPFKNSLYIFGGADRDNKGLSHVQVYSTKENTCSLLSKPMPRAYGLMRAVVWETSVILLGLYTCFIFNFETLTWQEREQFKTDVGHFGLVLENGRVFVIGGGICEAEKDRITRWKCRDDVRYVPLQNILDDKPIEWKIHAALPKPSLVYACASLSFFI